MAFTPITLRELRDKFGIEVNAHNDATCPFCGKKKKLHFDDHKDMWKCSKCGASGGVLHFFARYQLGMSELPSDPENRSEISQEMRRFLGYGNADAPRAQYKRLPPRPKKCAASDDQVHAVYTAMASLALFHLSSDHKKELKRRGLTSAQIERNGYRTFPYRTQIPADIAQIYNAADPSLKAEFSAKKAAQVQLGLLAARLLTEKGYDLDGIPGFYRFGDHWCLVYNPGIMIPIRNIHGQIVLWQVRRNYEPKYMTLSCAELPGAVRDDISRCHFPLDNDKLSDVIKVIYTEGPLKADIAKALSTDPCAFAAIAGIGNKRDLLENCQNFIKAGVTELYNALDMDRLTNPNVRNGSVQLDNDLRKEGMKVIPMYWGEKYAAEQLMIYQSIAKNRHVALPAYDYRLPVYEKLNIVANTLNQVKIDPGKQSEDSQYWESQSKGIDDYLFSLHQRKEHTQSEKTRLIQSYHETLLRINSQH